MKGYKIYFYNEKENYYFLYCINKSMSLSSLVSIYKKDKNTGYISNRQGKILRRF